MDEIKYELVRELGKLSQSKSGWGKELNIIRWNDGDEKFDIRQWAPEHAKMGKGISLSREEALALKELLDSVLNENE